MLNLDRMTYGYELELGDIRRDRTIPNSLGTWEYAECDICNIYRPYKNVACDPLGLDPPMGGEINIHPARTIKELVTRVINTIDWFKEQGDQPSIWCATHGHVHIHVPGLRDDVYALKRLTQYIKDNQHAAIKAAYRWVEHPDMRRTKTAYGYMKWDGGRFMPDWMSRNILMQAMDFDDFIRIQCCGKDGVSRGRPFRYGINTYCLKHTDTIEMRCFRSTMRDTEIFDTIRFTRDFIKEALTDQRPIDELLRRNGYQFPAFKFDLEQWLGWEATKWPKERGKKERRYVEV